MFAMRSRVVRVIISKSITDVEQYYNICINIKKKSLFEPYYTTTSVIVSGALYGFFIFLSAGARATIRAGL